MTFADELKAELRKQLPKDRVKFMKGWRTRGDSWLTGNGRPVGHLHHHTAGAATSSRDPKNPGNKPGANSGIVQWCYAPRQSHSWSNATIDRDGTLYINGANANWHAGLGDFAGTRWARLGVKRDMGNRALWGTEIVSKGTSRDLTKAQIETIDALNVALRAACGWNGYRYRLMNHKDWAPSRKSDTLYPWRKWVRRARIAWLRRVK